MQNDINLKNEVWAFIPARGGSKSIRLKNMVDLGGRPLIDYVIKAAKASHRICRIVCSTDHEKISNYCLKNGIEVQKRPSSLAQDDVSTLDVVIHFLKTFIKTEGMVASTVALLEPTSPFVLPKHIDDCVNLLLNDKDADSVQTITPVIPNHHAYNQRYVKDGLVYFKFTKEREGLFNKQLKPEYFVHGNLRIFRSSSVLRKKDLFGNRSIAYIISRLHAFDLDGPEDLELANYYLRSGKLELD